jgi:hypothetical protein
VYNISIEPTLVFEAIATQIKIYNHAKLSMNGRAAIFDKVYELMDNMNEKRESSLKMLLNTLKASIIEYQKTFIQFNLKTGLPI